MLFCRIRVSYRVRCIWLSCLLVCMLEIRDCDYGRDFCDFSYFDSSLTLVLLNILGVYIFIQKFLLLEGPSCACTQYKVLAELV